MYLLKAGALVCNWGSLSRRLPEREAVGNLPCPALPKSQAEANTRQT